MAITTKNINEVKTGIKKFLFKSNPNDYFHLLRVAKIAREISEKEGGDSNLTEIAALVHDLCRPWELETGKSHYGKEALQIILRFLKEQHVSESDCEKIIPIVEKHDEYDWTEKDTNKSIELKIIQDADNLDALGAVGISRVFSFGGAHAVPIYIAEENLEFTEDFVESTGVKKSSIAHFYEKLLKLKDNMNTATGHKLAIKRHRILEEYLKNFFEEFQV